MPQNNDCDTITDVYYADLFIINGKGCVIMGHGKSKTCRNYTGSSTVEVGTDSIRLGRKGNVVTAYYDPFMGLLPFDPDRTEQVKVDYFIYMQSQDETLGKEISAVSGEEFGHIARFNILYEAPDKESRANEFLSLVQGTDIGFITVPWQTDMATKGELLSQYLR